MKIIILGPPGSGKGVQSRLMKEWFNLEVLSIGELLRKEIKDKTELGCKIEYVVKNGLLVDESIVCDIVKSYINQYDDILLDGFPRTASQLKFLEDINFKVDVVIKLNIDTVTLLKRVKYRLICFGTQVTYNIIYNKPKIKDLDNLSGEPLLPRSDDKYNILLSRVDFYNKEILNVLDYFVKKKVKVINIESVNDKYLVFNKIKDAIKNE